MEPGGSMSHSQGLSNDSYPEQPKFDNYLSNTNPNSHTITYFFKTSPNFTLTLIYSKPDKIFILIRIYFSKFSQ